MIWECYSKTKFFLDSYSAWVYRLQAISQRRPLFHGMTVRLFINGIIVLIIFMLINKIVMPEFSLYMNNIKLIRVVCLFISFLIASPFIWGMLFSYKSVTLPEYAKTWMNPAMFIAWFVTLIELELLSLIYFPTKTAVITTIIIMLIYFILSYKQLEKSYQWFEEQFLRNIKNNANKQSQYEALAPWDTHLVEIDVREDSVLIWKSLRECNIRTKYGINIVAIYHGHRCVVVPRGEEKILPNDKLIVLGTDEQIERFRNKIETVKQIYDEIDLSSLFSLRSYLLTEKHELIGKTIRNSKIRETMHGLVVGLERSNSRILNPDPDFVLQEGDLLLVVGEIKKKHL
ncbi:MAG: hypothetical protein A3F12_02165 [Gammaproteobacteria bacterium RIFCSPHIGHO2_12_FULL_38_14]|nr:MAG: hypothetical protein A3F12_02165 [Gammaproteobacteria bacterium RIFCSPHIGHO2_12_FULL_38_14]